MCKGWFGVSSITGRQFEEEADLIFLEAEIVSLGKKSVVVEVKAYREKSPGSRDLAADAKFVFVSISHDEDVVNKPEFLPYNNHGLTL